MTAEVDEAVLRHVTAHIPAGQQVALVGATGSGKTTLGRLIARFADPTIGQIRLGGVPAARRRQRRAARPARRRLAGAVPVRRHDRRQRRLRPARDVDRRHGGGRRPPRPRRLGGVAARRADDRRRRARRAAVGRRAPARRPAACRRRRSRRARARRGDVVGRRADRGAHLARARPTSPRAARRSPSPTACRPRHGPTGCSCSTTAGSSRTAPTTSSSPPAAPTPASTPPGCTPPPPANRHSTEPSIWAGSVSGRPSSRIPGRIPPRNDSRPVGASVVGVEHVGVEAERDRDRGPTRCDRSARSVNVEPTTSAERSSPAGTSSTSTHSVVVAAEVDLDRVRALLGAEVLDHDLGDACASAGVGTLARCAASTGPGSSKRSMARTTTTVSTMPRTPSRMPIDAGDDAGDGEAAPARSGVIGPAPGSTAPARRWR